MESLDLFEFKVLDPQKARDLLRLLVSLMNVWNSDKHNVHVQKNAAVGCIKRG